MRLRKKTYFLRVLFFNRKYGNNLFLDRPTVSIIYCLFIKLKTDFNFFDAKRLSLWTDSEKRCLCACERVEPCYQSMICNSSSFLKIKFLYCNRCPKAVLTLENRI